MPATDHTGHAWSRGGPEISVLHPQPRYNPSALGNWLLGNASTLPTYLTQQCSLDWHHISQVKWKLVPNPGAQPKEKHVSGSRIQDGQSVIQRKNSSHRGGWHFAGETWKRHDPRFTMVSTKAANAWGPNTTVTVVPGTLEKPDELWNNETGMLCFQNTCISYLKYRNFLARTSGSQLIFQVRDK